MASTNQVNVINNSSPNQWRRYSVYRDSGVEWLGEIPGHWEVNRLKWVAPVSSKKLNEKPDELLYLGLENIEPKTGKLLLDEPTEKVESTVAVFERENVLFGKLRPYLAKVVYSEFSGVCTTELLVLQTTHDICGKFLFYQLLSDGFIDLTNSLTYGTKMPRVSGEQVGNLLSVVPPLPEQKAIASFLDKETARIDDLVEKKERLLKLLKEKRTALISHAVTKGLDPSVAMKDSGIEWLGEIPGHWGVKQLKFVCKFLDSRRIPLSSEQRAAMPKKFPYYGASGIIDYVEDYLFDESLILVAEDGANLFSRSSPLAFVASGKYWVNNHAHILKPNYEFLSYWSNLLASIVYDPWITGSAQPKLTADNLGSIHLPVPPLHEQKAIASYLDQETLKLDNLIKKIRQSIATQKEYRTALISAAVTGKIDVR